VKVILESGHYYQAKGVTKLSEIGWSVLENLKSSRDETVLYVDDVHGVEDVGEEERNLPVIPFIADADNTILESAMVPYALTILEKLKNLSRKKRARVGNDGRWFCSGFSVTNKSGFPNCVLLDAGLTLWKSKQGFKEGINILPWFYESEQRDLLRLIAKAIPDFSLTVILYDLNGKFWEMEV